MGFLNFLLFYNCQLEIMRFIHSFDNMFLFSNHNVTHMNVSKQYNDIIASLKKTPSFSNDQAPGLQSHLNFKVDLNLRFSLKIDKSVLQSLS